MLDIAKATLDLKLLERRTSNFLVRFTSFQLLVETSFEWVESEVDLSVLQEVLGVEDAVAGGADTLSEWGRR